MKAYLTPQQAAEFLGISKSYLAARRCVTNPLYKQGPRFNKIGTMIRYSEADLTKWVRQNQGD